MSASREKNKRKEQTQSGITPEVKSEKKGMSKGAKTALGIVIAVVVIAVVVFFSMLSNGSFARNTTAAVVGEHKLSPAMVNYYAADAYTNFTSTYSSYVSMFFDTSKSLSSQYIDEENGQTWSDYFIEQGLNTAAQNYAIYDEAVASGFTLSEEQEATIQTQIDSMETYVKAYGYSSFDSFLIARYGAGCNTKNYAEFLRIGTTAQAYANSLDEARTYTTEQLDAEYAENPNDYDTVDFRYYFFSMSNYAEESSTDSEEELTDEQKEAQTTLQMAKAKADAEAMLAAITDEQSFSDLALEYAPEDSKSTYEDDAATLNSAKSYSSCPSDLADWLFDSARAEGDTTCVESTSGYYVAYFISRDTHDTVTKNVRHILIPVSDSSDEQAVADAHAKAQEILDEFLASGDTSEDAFAALSDELVANGTSSEATKYENVYPGQMVESFENWCYDEIRQVGDTGVIDSSYGSHIMFFCGNGDKTHRELLVENALRQNAYNEWYSAATEGATYEKVSFGMLFVNKL